jgi:hypothetical protein
MSYPPPNLEIAFSTQVSQFLPVKMDDNSVFLWFG